MAGTSGMFLFEVTVEKVESFVESRHLIIKSDFANIFSLELRDPKTLNFVMPEPPPLPPEPPGKKKKKPPKPKKGKKGQIELPPPEPVIKSGQSVLFTSTAELISQAMKEYPMHVSLWSKEEHLVHIGACDVIWDPVFLDYLRTIFHCEQAPPPVVNDTYNFFEEGSPKIIAKLTLNTKLSYLTERMTSSFRTLSEDPSIKKVLYTGMNNRNSSYMCTLKTTDEEFTAATKQLENGFYKDIQSSNKGKPVNYADYKNAPCVNPPIVEEQEYCCLNRADKPPDIKYNSPETCPDINFICDYVRNMISSCNDSMRMLTPRPTIRPRFKATDIDRLCYCKEDKWPEGKLAEQFKKVVKSSPCPICAPDKTGVANFGPTPPKVIDIDNIRGPCGRADCKIARELRSYISKLVEEDNKEININDIFGPCGSKECTVVEKIKDFLTHKGAFSHGGTTKEALDTQCSCIQQMKNELVRKDSCDTLCSHDCEDQECSSCDGNSCPFKKKPRNEDETKVYNVYYFTVEYDNNDPSSSSAPSRVTSAASRATSSTRGTTGNDSSVKGKYCGSTCPSMATNELACSADICGFSGILGLTRSAQQCVGPVCPDMAPSGTSPADSDIIVPFSGIRNPCCVDKCPVAEQVRNFVAVGLAKRSKSRPCLDSNNDPCYCDCTCEFGFSAKTTYCAICGGYECLGNDMKEQPEYCKPHPCPVYHKLYDRNVIKTKSPWPEENQQNIETVSTKSKTKNAAKADSKSVQSERKDDDSDSRLINKEKKNFKSKDKKGNTNGDDKSLKSVTPSKKSKVKPVQVPWYMGWLWNAKDIPGLPFRPTWKPGAAHKVLVRRYKSAREGQDVIGKKKRAMLNKKKKIEMKPTLVVTKKDGEYTVQMEVFKKYSKERLRHQYPYDEKPPVIYTVGKTPETKQKLARQHDRRQRREMRRKCKLLQSTFRDKCQEICLKAYNQAIGIQPLPNPNNPECPCEVPAIGETSPVIDSCSCSDEGTISSDDTDGDDWVIEFTPPIARWDAAAKHTPLYANNDTQYTYLDYRVKLVDKQGNEVPRFFKGPDGKQQCSDLGGFWNAQHEWLEINRDGYIGPDGRWIPLSFIGPDGQVYSSEEGTYIDHENVAHKIGVDGYIDKDNKWVWYPKKNKESSVRSVTNTTVKTSHASKSETSKSHADHGDHKGVQNKTHKVVAVRAPPDKHKATPPKLKAKNSVIVAQMGFDKQKSTGRGFERKSRSPCTEVQRLDVKRAQRYQEIMEDMYDDLRCTYDEFRPITAFAKTNRAVNTPQPAVCTSPYTINRAEFCPRVAGRTCSIEKSNSSTLRSKLVSSDKFSFR